VAVVEAQGEELRARMEKAEIRSPVAGVVTRRAVEPGFVTGAGSDPLLRVIAESIVELAVETPDQDLSRVEPGMSAGVTLADGTLLEGKVRLVSPVVDPRSRFGTVLISLPVDRRLRPGAFAHAEIVVDRREAPVVPLAAVDVRDGTHTAIVVENGRALRRELRLGAQVGGSVEVLDGLGPGDEVVLGGGAFIQDRMPVRTVVAVRGNDS
jgi:HlyD family secretion protein